MLVAAGRRFLKSTRRTCPARTRNSGPGNEPLKVQVFADRPPRSTTSGAATSRKAPSGTTAKGDWLGPWPVPADDPKTRSPPGPYLSIATPAATRPAAARNDRRGKVDVLVRLARVMDRSSGEGRPVRNQRWPDRLTAG